MKETITEKLAFIIFLIIASYFLIKEGISGIKKRRLLVPTEDNLQPYMSVKGRPTIIFSILYFLFALIAIVGAIYNLFSLFRH